ncbi:MAG: biopolymer transporter ExbD [Gemmatimonadaceae bacterium]|nr:biopolymer transporter ExbD [Gemmatimonadaceae bacterium]NUQ94179.1 biopolymer transporter ExbD [Gemmatimonadaceae bacterium]NUR18232.1 biopolymer transporter ExbD [Gemmatimonadaceae bacterium]NUS97601.1 biopolymer transporter ExbD [Gemmatimonadaceae bacterium]
MAGSLFHKSKQRRAERAPMVAHGGLNLVPLVDILTSIVFFSLLTYTGAALAALTAFDLALPPTVITGQQPKNSAGQPPELNLLLAVKVSGNGLRIEHSGGGGFVKEIPGLTEASFDQLRQQLAQIRQAYPDNKDVLVVPDDAVNYDNVIRVLEQAKATNYTGISLGSRSRSTQVATASPVANRGGR